MPQTRLRHIFKIGIISFTSWCEYTVLLVEKDIETGAGARLQTMTHTHPMLREIKENCVVLLQFSSVGMRLWLGFSQKSIRRGSQMKQTNNKKKKKKKRERRKILEICEAYQHLVLISPLAATRLCAHRYVFDTSVDRYIKLLLPFPPLLLLQVSL